MLCPRCGEGVVAQDGSLEICTCCGLVLSEDVLDTSIVEEALPPEVDADNDQHAITPSLRIVKAVAEQRVKRVQAVRRTL